MVREKFILENGEEIFLSKKEVLFAENYLANGFNATLAAVKAGYSPKSAKVQASRMLTNANLSKYMKWKSTPVIEELEITRERVIKEMAAIAFAKPTDFLNSDLSLKDLNQMKREMLPAIKQIEKTDRGFRVVFHDKISSLSKLSELIKEDCEKNKTENNDIFKSINHYLSNYRKPE